MHQFLEKRLLNAFFGVFALLTAAPGFSDERELQETLERMERLLQQQQSELEAQRTELAEQRELIRQLQQGGQAAATTTPESSTATAQLADEGAAEESDAG